MTHDEKVEAIERELEKARETLESESTWLEVETQLRRDEIEASDFLEADKKKLLEALPAFMALERQRMINEELYHLKTELQESIQEDEE